MSALDRDRLLLVLAMHTWTGNPTRDMNRLADSILEIDTAPTHELLADSLAEKTLWTAPEWQAVIHLSLLTGDLRGVLNDSPSVRHVLGGAA